MRVSFSLLGILLRSFSLRGSVGDASLDLRRCISFERLIRRGRADLKAQLEGRCRASTPHRQRYAFAPRLSPHLVRGCCCCSRVREARRGWRRGCSTRPSLAAAASTRNQLSSLCLAIHQATRVALPLTRASTDEQPVASKGHGLRACILPRRLVTVTK